MSSSITNCEYGKMCLIFREFFLTLHSKKMSLKLKDIIFKIPLDTIKHYVTVASLRFFDVNTHSTFFNIRSVGSH